MFALNTLRRTVRQLKSIEKVGEISKQHAAKLPTPISKATAKRLPQTPPAGPRLLVRDQRFAISMMILYDFLSK